MLKHITHFVKQSWLLVVASFAFGLLIAFTNAAWRPKIDANAAAKFSTKVSGLLPSAKNFEPITGKFQIDEKLTTEVYQARNDMGQLVGFAFAAQGPGYDKIEIVIAVNEKCSKLMGYGVLVCNETPGFGDAIKSDVSEWYEQFIDVVTAQPLKLVKTGDVDDKDPEIVAITGATISSQGVVDIFNNYMPKIKEQLLQKGMIQE